MKIQIPDRYSQLEHVSFLGTSTIFEYAKYLWNKEWVVLVNKTKIPLWTSDNPISFYNTFGRSGYNMGIFSPGIEIRFPLSSELLLFSYDPNTHPPILNKNKMSEDDVLLSNNTQIRTSTRFIYSAANSFEYASEYLKKYPRYKDPGRKRWDLINYQDRIEFGRID